MPSSIMMPMPRRSLYSENGVTALSRGKTAVATSLAWLMGRGLMLNSLQIRMSEPSVPPAQSESHGVICRFDSRTSQMTPWDSNWAGGTEGSDLRIAKEFGIDARKINHAKEVATE